MFRMLRLARLAPVVVAALLSLMLALSYAVAQSNVPAAPTIDSVTPGDTTLAVAWTAPAGETGITAYDVRHIETSEDETDDTKWTVVDNAWASGALEYTTTMLTNGTQYDVQVRAVNSNGDGTWSGTEVGTPALPAPTIGSVRADDRALLISWSAPTGITSKVEAYDVRYIETSADEAVDANWTVVEDAWEGADGSLTYAITGLTNGTEYDVQVRAVDEDDVNGAWSATTSATPEDHGDNRADATSITTDARIWGAIDPTDDEDYFSFSVSGTADFWIYTLGDLDSVAELQDSNGLYVESSDYGAVLPNPDNFFLWRKLQSGTYYIKVTGYGPAETPYILRIRTFTDTTSRSNAATLNFNGSASGTIDPDSDEDYFKLQLSVPTEVVIRASGFPDTVGELQNSGGGVIASNDDGFLPGGRRNFLIRENLPAGIYYVKVRSFANRSDGPYSVYATAITEPGSSITNALPLNLGDTAGGIIDPAGDEDYFSLTLDETTFVIVGGVSQVIDISGELLDSNNLRAPVDSIHFADVFIFQGRLDAGTYHLKVTGKDGTETGRYTVRAIREGSYTYFVDRCSNISRSSGIDDPLYGCQWHLNNTNQFRSSAGQDIRVEEVWPTYTGDGITVVVVDDGMHYTHEDLTDNVHAPSNHNYDPDQTDIYNYFEDHGTAVAGLIAAKDNSLGVRGVAPEATIYGYNYLVEQTDANEANAMSRNAATTAVSNNSWGPGDYGRPQHATELWELAVKDGVTNGYGGKGVFYAWAGGNGGEDDDRSNLDELASYYAVTAVCAVGHDDKRSSYSEPGSNLWVCGPSSSGRVGQPRIATTDNGNRYRGSFGGTSAATPIVSGVVALIREANNTLTWRDVKLILAASARKNDPDNTGWEQGALKYGSTTDHYNYNDEYGFGMVDAKAAVDLAPGWTKVPKLREITSESAVINLAIPDAPTFGTPTTVSTSLTIDPYVEFIEFVEVNTHFNHLNFRDLSVELVSPSGAVSVLTTSAPVNGGLTSAFRFGSARHLGEDAAGEWTLRIKDLQRGRTGMLRSWGLTIYGHGSIPGAPEIDTVTPGGGTLVVEWKEPTITGATAITSYVLRYIREDATDRSDDKWTLETGVGTLTNRSHTITGLEGGVKYEYQIRAHNDAGPGPWSKAEGEVPITVTSSAPSITNVTRGDRTLAFVWTAPNDTGGGEITAYDVRYIETSADEMVDSNWTVRDNAWRSGELRYVVRNLTNATEYDVQVRAVNSAGDGAWSATETDTPLPDDTPITLQWEQTTLVVDEDAGSVALRAVFTTTLNAPPAADFAFGVTLTTTDLGTTLNDDYTPPPSSANFVASDFSQTDVSGQQRYRATRDFSVVIVDDTTDESVENFRVTINYLTPGLAHLQGGPQSATVTITDNEHVPVTISWEQADVTVDENAGTVTLRAQAVTATDKRPEDGFSFDASVYTTNGSAVQPDDYAQVDETLTFSRSDFSRATVNGERRYRAAKQIVVDIEDDTTDEAEEDFTLTLEYSNAGLLHLQGGSAVANVKITDNDHVPITISWKQSTHTVDEDVGTLTLNAVLVTTKDKAPESGFSVRVTVSTADGSAQQNADYRRLSTTVTFRQADFTRAEVNGDQRYLAERPFTISIFDDNVDEENETFTVSLAYSGASQPHLLEGTTTANVTIVDNDHVPVTLGWEQTTFSVDENVGAVTLRAVAVTTKDKLPEPGSSFDVSVSTSDGGATQPEDYSQLSDTVTFSRTDFSPATVNGQQRYSATKQFTVLIADDTEDESDESFTATLELLNASLTHLQLGPSTATVTIVDNEHVPVTIDWERTTVTVDEGGPTATLRAVAVTTKDKMPETGFSFDVSVYTADGSASQNTDYTRLSDTVTFDRTDFSRAAVSGQRRYRAVKQVEVAIVDDTDDEPDEDLTVTMAYANPGLPHLQGGPATATVTITDNDHVPVTIEWEQTFFTVDEGAGAVTLRAVAVTTKDKMPEPGFSFSVSTYTAEGTASRIEDYRALDTTTAFNRNDFSQATVNGLLRYRAVKEFPLNIVDDANDEPDESFTATVAYSNPGLPHLQGSSSSATVTITDNDHVSVVLGWEQTAFVVEEASTPGSTRAVTLRAVAVTTKDKRPETGFSFDASVATADGSATQPADYEPLSTTVTFSRSDFSPTTINGERLYHAEKQFNVLIKHDNALEPNERFTVRLAYSGPGQPHLLEGDLTATVTITDDISSTVDLAASVFGSSSRASRGDELVYSYTVTNNGPATSTRTVLTTTLDPGVSFISATSTFPCSHSGRSTGGVVTCEFGTLTTGGTASGTIAVRVAPTAAADITATFSANGRELDNSPGNNTTTGLTELDAPLQRVTSLRATGDTDHIDLSWSRPADNGSPITAYELERKEEGGTYAPVSPPPAVSATTYLDNQVSDGTTYTYQLRAINADGEAEWSNESTATPGVTSPPPPPPPLITGVIGGAVPSGGGGGGGGAPPASSLIVFAPSSLSFEAVVGGDNPPSQTLRVWNSEEREMAFGTSENAAWLSRTPSAGISDGPDDAVRITLSVNVSSLEAGSYTASVRISGRRIGNSPQRVPVTLTVRSPGYARERVSPGERTEIVTPDSTLRLIVPENAVSADVDIEAKKLDVDSLPAPPVEQERVVLAVELNTFSPGGETAQPSTYSPGAELRLLLPEDEEASCDAGRVRVYRVDAGEWELLEHRCETDDTDRVWAVSVLTSFSTFVLAVDDTAYPTGSICWSVSNILSWTTSKTSGSQSASNTLLVWLEGVLRLWLSLSCR